MPGESTRLFYQNLPRMTKIEDMTSSSLYRSVPADWILVMTDVRGSTKAIKDGRYKDVNVVGACSIIAVQNACQGLEFPFVFGGDGATILLPPSDLEKGISALVFNRRWAQEQFGLDLRIAQIPVADILSAGHDLSVGKYSISSENAIALLSGTGIGHGERLMKQENSPYAVNNTIGEGSMQGLECRWNPIRSKKYGMLALIVQSALENQDRFAIYRQVLNGIQTIVTDLKPIRADNLRASWPPKHLYAEARVRYNSKIAQWLWLIMMMPVMLLLSLVITVFRHGKNNGVSNYIESLSRNTDHIKFDETLRMVLDVSEPEYEKILTLLKNMHQKGMIVYGTHLSDEALMTCFIQSLSQHIHFVDGGTGGYTMAAVGLKKQRLEKAAGLQ